MRKSPCPRLSSNIRRCWPTTIFWRSSPARAQSALSAVARRRGLSEIVSDAIVASLDIPSVAALLVNPDARIREGTMEKIIDHAESISQWHGPLVMRTDLSLRALRRITGFVGASLLETLSERHGLDDETQAHLKRCMRQRLERDEESSQRDEDKLHAEVLNAFETGLLDEHYVEDAIEIGDRGRVMECLAVLVQVPRSVIEKIFTSRSSKAITALVWKAGLTMRIAFKIQTLVLKLHADELLPGRAGVGFPLSEEEMRWHLSYFGFSEK